MATCKLCDRTGFFLSTNDLGICKTCTPFFALDFNQRMRILSESIKLGDKSKKLDVRLSRYELALEHANGLLKYETAGIDTTEPPPSVLIEKVGRALRETAREGMSEIAEKALAKSGGGKTLNARLNPVNKAIIALREYSPRSDSSDLIDELVSKLQAVAHAAQFDDYMEKGRKAEFKSQTKKALDAYYDALYFLRHDDIDDAEQGDQIGSLEAKIRDLGGDVQ